MANLIDQMNILKGLDDQSLGAELNRPSGAVPPYLVMSEISRRKDMRQRYQGQLAQQQPATTVLQDQLSALAPPSGVAAGQGASPAMLGGFGSSPAGSGAPMPAPPMGISAAPQAAAPTGYRQGGIVHYAGGGLVGDPSSYWLDPDQSVDDTVNLPVSVGVPALTNAETVNLPPAYMQGINASGINVPSQASDPMSALPIDSATPTYAGTSMAAADPSQALPPAPQVAVASPYDAIAAQYQKILDSGADDKKQAQALALIQAGAAIAAGTSPYALSNIGAGAEAGVKDYASSLGDMKARQAQALAGLSSVQRDKLAQQNEQFNQGIQTSDLALKQKTFDASQDPNSPQNTPVLAREAQIYNAMPETTPDEIAAKQAFKQTITPFAAQNAAAKVDDATTAAKMIHDGDLMPPTSLGTGGQGTAINAAFGRMYPGESIAQLALDAQGAKAWASHMNGQPMIKQQANLTTADDQLTKLQTLADQWKAGNFPTLNSVIFKSALEGGLGPDANSLAAQFQQQLAEAKLTMQQVFAGGYAGTDKQLAQIDNMFTTAAPNRTFDDLIGLSKLNVGYRRNALASPEAYGAGGFGTNVYTNGGSGAPATTGPAPSVPTAPAGSPIKITGDADYNALPSGTSFVGPDGVPRRKP